LRVAQASQKLQHPGCVAFVLASAGIPPGGLPGSQHVAGQVVRLAPMRRRRRCAVRTAGPPRDQRVQIRQPHAPACRRDHFQAATLRPDHQSGATVGPFEGCALVAGGLVEVLLIGLQIPQGARRGKLFVAERKGSQISVPTIGAPPVGQCCASRCNDTVGPRARAGRREAPQWGSRPAALLARQCPDAGCCLRWR